MTQSVRESILKSPMLASFSLSPSTGILIVSFDRFLISLTFGTSAGPNHSKSESDHNINLKQISKYEQDKIGAGV
jgi:hypothetical protein